MGYITSVLIWYERIGKYHHNYVLFFCKDMDKTMNLMLFCWILVCFNMFLVNICKRYYYLATGALTSCARFCVVEKCQKNPHSRAVPASFIYIRKIYLTTHSLLKIEVLTPFLSRKYENIYFSTINSSQVSHHKSVQPACPFEPQTLL